jgi:hypothetical protein
MKPFPMIDATVEVLIKKIRAKEFTPDPPIVFYRDSGHWGLKDGLHRLSAIYHSGETVQVRIKFEDHKNE